MYKLVNKAQQYQKQNLFTKELEIYEDIHENYFPNSSKLFKRPAVLYERIGEYEKAYQLCKKAIELIDEEKISGTKASFERMSEILKRKMDDSTYKKPKNKKRTKIAVGFITILILVFVGLYLLSQKESPYEDMQIDLSEMEGYSNNEEIFNEEPPEYIITSEMVKRANKAINLESDVINSTILSNNSSIGFGILVKKGTSYTRSKRLAKKFVSELGKAAASEYNFISENKIYDYYNIYISTGTSSKKEDIILKAFKIKKAKNLKFK